MNEGQAFLVAVDSWDQKDVHVKPILLPLSNVRLETSCSQHFKTRFTLTKPRSKPPRQVRSYVHLFRLCCKALINGKRFDHIIYLVPIYVIYVMLDNVFKILEPARQVLEHPKIRMMAIAVLILNLGVVLGFSLGKHEEWIRLVRPGRHLTFWYLSRSMSSQNHHHHHHHQHHSNAS